MKERIADDARSSTIHTATAHVAPSFQQNHFLMERFTKEFNLSSPRKIHDQRELTNSMRGIELPRLSPRAAEMESWSATQTLSSVRRSPRRGSDMEFLRQHGRKKYLHMKRLEPSAQDDIVSLFQSSSRQIGEQLYAGESPFSPLQPAVEDFRRQGGGMKSSFRTKGVFHGALAS